MLNLPVKLPNPLSKKEMKMASESDKSDVIDRMQGVWPQVNTLSLVLCIAAFTVCIAIVLFYYMKYTSLYYWMALLIIPMIVLLADRLYVNHFSPEAPLFTQCRRKNLPLGRIHWGNGMETWEPLYKDKKGSLFFKRFGKIFGLDMTLYNEARSSFCRGIEVIDYFTDSLLPFGGMHAASAFQSADYLRDTANGYPRLANMPLHSMMVLVNKPLSKLSNDVYKYVNVERKEEMSKDDYDSAINLEAGELIDEVKSAQEALRGLPVLHGVFNWNVISQIENTQLDVKWAEDMQSEIRKETINEEESDKRHGRWVVWAIGLIIAGGIAGLLILSQLH